MFSFWVPTFRDKLAFRYGSRLAQNGTLDIYMLHSVAEGLGQDMCALILPYHALTGCDSTSSFKGKGKKRPLDLLQENTEKFLTW